MTCPCEECISLAMCIPKFKDENVVKCDIVWEYVVIDTYIPGKPYYHHNSRRRRRLKEIENIFNKTCLVPEDESDRL